MNKFIYLVLMLSANPIFSSNNPQASRKNRRCCDIRSYLPALHIPSYTRAHEIWIKTLSGGALGFLVGAYGCIIATTHQGNSPEEREALKHYFANMLIPPCTCMGASVGAAYGMMTTKKNNTNGWTMYPVANPDLSH